MTGAAALASPDPGARLRAVAAIAARGVLLAGEMEALVERLADPDKRVQRGAAETLAAVAAASARLDALLEAALRGADRRARWGAAFCEAARRRPSAAAVVVWIDHLASRDRDLRWAAHDLLVRHAPRLGAEVPSLLREAAAGGDAQRRKMALYCLRDIGGADAAGEALARAALDAAEIEVRLAALAAYAAIAVDRRRAARLLCGYLGDDDPRMRRATASALGKMGSGGAEVLAALEAAACSVDPGLRRAALGALAMVERD